MTRLLTTTLLLTGVLSIAGCPTTPELEAELLGDTTDAPSPAPNLDAPAPSPVPDDIMDDDVVEDVVDETPVTTPAPTPQPVPMPAPSAEKLTDFAAGFFSGEIEMRVNVYQNNQWVDMIVETETLDLTIDANGRPLFEDGDLLTVGTITEEEGLRLEVVYVDVAPTAISISQNGTLDDTRIESGTYTGTTTLEWVNGQVRYSNSFSIVSTFADGGNQRQDWSITGALTTE